MHTTVLHLQKKRFEKGFLAEIYSLCASERLMIYLHPIFSHFLQNYNFMINMETIPKFDTKSVIKFDISTKPTTWIGH